MYKIRNKEINICYNRDRHSCQMISSVKALSIHSRIISSEGN